MSRQRSVTIETIDAAKVILQLGWCAAAWAARGAFARSAGRDRIRVGIGQKVRAHTAIERLPIGAANKLDSNTPPLTCRMYMCLDRAGSISTECSLGPSGVASWPPRRTRPCAVGDR